MNVQRVERLGYPWTSIVCVGHVALDLGEVQYQCLFAVGLGLLDRLSLLRMSISVAVLTELIRTYSANGL